MIGFPGGYYANQLEPSESGAVAVLVGAFMLLKKKIYQHINGFDEDYFMFGEDIDMSYKVLKAGYQNRYFGEAAIIHFKVESTIKNHNYAKQFSEAMQIFYDHHFQSSAFFNVLIKTDINCSRRLLNTSYVKPKKVSNYVVLSKNSNFSATLPHEVEIVRLVKDLSVNTRVYFDVDTIGYQNIITIMRTSDPNRRLSYRILPNNAQYSIGSDSSQHRGEVVLLN